MTEVLRYEGNTDFFDFLMAWQFIFETERVGTDSSLFDKNTVVYGLERGIIGEAREAIAEAWDLYMAQVLTPDKEVEIAEIRERLHDELSDCFIFMASVFMHAGMTYEDIISHTLAKLDRNAKKYDKRNFEGRTIQGAIDYSRDAWDRSKEVLLGTTVEPSSGRDGEKPQEYDDSEVYAGSHT